VLELFLAFVAHADHFLVVMTADHPRLEAASRTLRERRADDEPAREREQHDHDRAADELGGCELPAHEHDEHDAELEDEVRAREHEHHCRDEVGTFLEQRLRHRGRRVRAARRHHPEPGRACDGRRTVIAEDALHLLLRHEGLHRAREGESQDERPQRRPEHKEALAEAVADVAKADRGDDVHNERTIRAIASDASRTFALALSSPSATASVMQCARCSSSSPSATACNARVTAATWSRTSMQYRSSSIIRWRPRTCPSIRRSRFWMSSLLPVYPAITHLQGAQGYPTGVVFRS
jgi:hypothetical protein